MKYRELLEACWKGYRRVPGTSELRKDFRTRTRRRSQKMV